MNKHNQVNWGKDCIIDSRDINEYLAELQSEFDDLEAYLNESKEELEKFCKNNNINQTNDYSFDDLEYIVIDDPKIKQELLSLIEDIAKYESNLEDFDHDELKLFQQIVEEGEDNVRDWTHGEALIHEEYFTQYAQELAEDVGAVSGTEKWPPNCVDWEEAARLLKQDYTTIDFGGHTYYVRP